MKGARLLVMVCAPLELARVLTVPQTLSAIDASLTDTHHARNALMLPPVDFGRTVPVPGLKAKGLGGKTLLAICGTCASCMVSMINPEAIDARRYEHVVLIFASPLSEVPKVYHHLGANVELIADPDGRAVKEMGLLIDPRFFLLTSDLRLIDAQESIDRVPEFVKRKAT